MNGLDIVRGLMARGYSPHHAAALAGHMLQESGGNPSAVNAGEGANGLLQWRLDRWAGLQDYAKSVGKSPNDPDVQMDFIGREMQGPEKRSGSAFLAAPDLDTASAALKGYIRFGDKSDEVRLNNARGLFSQLGNAPVGALASAAPAAAPAAANLGAAAAPAVGALATAPAAPGSGVASVGEGLGKLGGQLQQQVEFLPAPEIQMARPNTGMSQQLAAALAKTYGIGA